MGFVDKSVLLGLRLLADPIDGWRTIGYHKIEAPGSRSCDEWPVKEW
jgi:hypothetical protein